MVLSHFCRQLSYCTSSPAENGLQKYSHSPLHQHMLYLTQRFQAKLSPWCEHGAKTGGMRGLENRSLQGRELEAQFSSVQSLSHVRLFATPWTTACQAPLSITNSWILLKLMSIELVMPSNHLILCHPLLLTSSIFPNIRVFSNESALRMRWPKYWSFSFSISPSNEPSGLISLRMDWLDLLAVQGTLKSLL